MEGSDVTLINTDGMAFIGPGSEWFWTALSGIVLAVTFLAIYRQLSMARSASAREQLDSFQREWESERMLRHGLAVLVSLGDGTDAAHLPEGSAAVLANFWDRLAVLTRSRLHDRKVVHRGYGDSCQRWWATLAPQVRRWRDESGEPRLIEDFEWLAGLMDDLDRRAGMATPTLDAAWLASSLADRITYCEEALRVEEALRTVIIAPPSPATAT